MRKHLDEGRDGPLGLFVDPMTGFVGMMLIVVMILLLSILRPQPLRLLPSEPPPCGVGLPYHFTVTAQGGFGDRTFSCQAGELPAGLRLNPRTGTVYGFIEAGTTSLPVFGASNLGLLGSPHGHGSLLAACALIPGRTGAKMSLHRVRITVTDSARASASHEFSFTPRPYAMPVGPEDTQVRLLCDSAELPAGRVGVPYEAVIGVAGGLGRVRWQARAGMPAGLDLVDGRVVGTPKAAGRFIVDANAELHGGSATIDGHRIEWFGSADSRCFSLRVLPILASTSRLPIARAGADWVATLFDSPLLPGETVVFEGLPEGIMSLPGARLAGAPKSPGQYPIKFRARSGNVVLAAGVVDMQVLPALPRAEAPPLTVGGRIGEHLRAVLPYRGLIEPVTLTLRPTLPRGLNWTGLAFEGVPEQAGLVPLSVQLRDAMGTLADVSLTVRILPRRESFIIAIPAVLDVAVGTPFSCRISTEGGEAPAIVEFLGEMPPGCSLKQGVFSAKLLAPGQWKLRLQATDPVNGERAGKEIVVRGTWATSEPLRILTEQLPTALVGDSYGVALAATGAAGPVTWRLERPLPDWLNLDGGILHGKPTASGKVRLKIRVRDAAGRTADAQELELRIERSERSRPAVLASEANGKSKSREKDEEKTIRKNSAGESSDKAEQEAIGKLKLAKILAEDGKTVRAKDRLKEIIASYPETKAAEEARHLLKKLDQ